MLYTGSFVISITTMRIACSVVFVVPGYPPTRSFMGDTMRC